MCEMGATASDGQQGVLTSQLLVCGQPFIPSGNQKLIPVLLACNISTLISGYYPITYSVTNQAGFTANVTRSLVVQQVCQAGERLCNDLVRGGGRGGGGGEDMGEAG